MFKDTVRGMDKVFRTDVLSPKIILVTGPPGSLKSSFIYSKMTRQLENTGEFGLYATLEETAESHLNNMDSLGLEPSLNLQISDFTDLRDESDSTDYLKFTEKMITHFKKTRGDKFTCFAFDSVGALYSLITEKREFRKKMFHFFKMLREKNLVSFIVIERGLDGTTQSLGNETFLADGIIALGLKRRQGRLIRYLQIEKMRATQHSMEMHALEVKNGGIAILGPIFD
ncbi:MAG: signal transduction protein [Thermoplasmata archaeon]|nr:MAG: signal transduction protein [Thermoplasmata archaeon]